MHPSTPTRSGLISRIEVLEKLRKQVIRVKGLDSAFCQWPFKVNPHVDEIRHDVSTRLSRQVAYANIRCGHQPRFSGDHSRCSATSHADVKMQSIRPSSKIEEADCWGLWTFWCNMVAVCEPGEVSHCYLSLNMGESAQTCSQTLAQIRLTFIAVHVG